MMELFRRVADRFRRDALHRELDEEMRSLQNCQFVNRRDSFGLLQIEVHMVSTRTCRLLSSRCCEAGRSALSVRGLLVITQLALSLPLAAGAAVFVRSLQNLRAVDPGFEEKQALLASVDLEQGGYTPATGGPVIQRIVAQLAAKPGVRNAAAASVVHPVP